jgi:hypothetical protein
VAGIPGHPPASLQVMRTKWETDWQRRRGFPVPPMSPIAKPGNGSIDGCPKRRFPPPRSVEGPDPKLDRQCFIVRDANGPHGGLKHQR